MIGSGFMLPNVQTCGSSRTEQDYYLNDELSVGSADFEIPAAVALFLIFFRQIWHK
jgi:hypothetical protein